MNKYFLNFYEFCGQSKRFRIQKTLFSFYFPSILNIMFGLFMAIVYIKMLVYMYDDFEYKGRIEGKKT